VDGFAFLDKMEWDAYHEGSYLIESVEAYRRRHGFYPEAVLADKIYRTRENRAYCKEKGIRLSCPKLGHPSNEAKRNSLEKKIAHQDAIERNAIEEYLVKANASMASAVFPHAFKRPVKRSLPYNSWS